MEKVKADILKTISGDHSQDRAYVNRFFSLVYSDRHLMKLATKHQYREKFLQELRISKRCANIKGIFFVNSNFKLIHFQRYLMWFILCFVSAMYDFRVVSNGSGNVAKRLDLYKLAFRTKVNNWWSSNAVKIPTPNEVYEI